MCNKVNLLYVCNINLIGNDEFFFNFCRLKIIFIIFSYISTKGHFWFLSKNNLFVQFITYPNPIGFVF